ncbi:Conserved_hypothetical protein [Hexamita inflata]|uniref:Uncharacterized protein n=1 Tax=Hexamita inflata TaxID=28002 RepID=A0AA86TAJ1_9EUKA|nr:Conserved hypothetical protein [Hexamita inflata]
MERCEAACNLFSTTKFTKDQLCQDACDGLKPVYVTGNLCVENCFSQASEIFLNEGSNQCRETCAHSSYYRNADGTLFCTSDVCGSSNFTGIESYHATYQRCESACALFTSLSFTDGSSCLEKCPDDRKYFIAAKNCSATCPDDVPYAEASNLCVSKCGSGNYAATAQKFECRAACDTYFVTNETNDNSHECVAECLSQPSKKFLDTDSTECLASCPQPFYNVVAATGFQVCLPNCDAGFHGKDATFDVSMERCEAACNLFSTTKFTKDQLCQDACDGLKPVYVTGNLCVENCFSQASEIFLNEGSNQCRETCAHSSYYRNADGTLFCTSDVCGSSNFTGVESYHATYQRCESACTLFANLTHTLGNVCVKSCPDTDKYVDPQLICYSVCPSLYSFAESTDQCVQRCDSGKYIKVTNQSQTLLCTPECTQYFLTNESNQDSQHCVDSCESQAVKNILNVANNECVSQCKNSYLSEDRTKCYTSCTLDNNNVLSVQKTHCVSNCFTSERSALSFAGGYCVSDCKSDNLDTDFNTEKTNCVLSCGSKFQNLERNGCVADCSTIHAVVNLQGDKCEATCSDGFLDVTSKKCVDSCVGLGVKQQDKTCICDATIGFALEGASCQCNKLLGLTLINDVCACNTLMGFLTSNDKCACDTIQGFTTNVNGICQCDATKGFVVTPTLNTTGNSVCMCDETMNYQPNAVNYVCLQNLSQQKGWLVFVIAGIAGLIVILLAIFCIVYWRKRSKKLRELKNDSIQQLRRPSQMQQEISYFKRPSQLGQQSVRKPSQLKLTKPVENNTFVDKKSNKSSSKSSSKSSPKGSVKTSGNTTPEKPKLQLEGFRRPSQLGANKIDKEALEQAAKALEPFRIKRKKQAFGQWIFD